MQTGASRAPFLTASPVDALAELASDFLVALAAGGRHVPMIDLGARIGRGIDVMNCHGNWSSCAVLAAATARAVNALLIGIRRVRHRNLMP